MRPPIALSQSGMKALNCPFSYQLKYLTEGFKEDQSIPAQYGTVGHRAAEEYIAHLARRRMKRHNDAFTEIIIRLTRDLPPSIAQPVLDAGEIFVANWELDLSATAHSPELLMVIDRETLQPSDNYIVTDEHVVATTRDLLTGRVDYRATFKGGRKSQIWDFKMGEEHVGIHAAEGNIQLLHYAALDFWSDPAREEVEVILWGVKYGRQNISRYAYGREAACEAARAHFEEKFGMLDALFCLDHEWPASSRCHNTCRYCPAPHLCPLTAALLPGIMELPLGSKRNAKH